MAIVLVSSDGVLNVVKAFYFTEVPPCPLLQVDLFVDQAAGREKKPDIIMYDRDTKFTKDFTTRLKERGLRTNTVPKASPNLNDRWERFIETIKLECLAKFIIFGKRHLDF